MHPVGGPGIYTTTNVYCCITFEGTTVRLAKWGNSLAVRLPSGMIEEMNLREGDEIELVKGEQETFIVYRYESPDELLQSIRRFRGRLPKGFRFDRDDAHAR